MSRMNLSSQHVIANLDGGWSVKSTGVQRAMRRFDTEQEAVEFARTRARSLNGAVLYFHRRDGTVREKELY